MNKSHTIEPELLGSTPRTVRFKDRRSIGALLFMFIFLCPFVYVGLSTFFDTSIATAVSLMGTTISADVSGKQVEDDSESGTSYRVYLDYRVGGEFESSSSKVSSSDYARLYEDQHVTIKILPLLPDKSPEIVGASAERWSTVKFFWGITLFWNAIVSVFLHLIFVRSLLTRKILVHGIATVGEISKKTRSESDGHTNYLLHYRFDPAGSNGATSQIATTTVTEAESSCVDVGDQVTVLYLPDKPNWSAIYPFSPYIVKPS